MQSGELTYRIIEWLRRYRNALSHEQYLQEEVLRARAQAEKMTASLTQAPGGGESPSLDRAYERVEAAEEKLLDAMEHSEQVKAKVESAIESVPGEGHRKVLRCIYIEGLSQGEAAEKLFYHRNTVHRLHDQAIEHFEKMVHDSAPLCIEL